MRFTRSTLVAAVICAGLAAAVAVKDHQLDNARERNGKLALEKTNAVAASTPTLVVQDPAVLKLLGDSVQMYRHLAVQQDQRADALDRALKLERIGKAEMVLQLDSLRRQSIASSQPVTEDSSGIRRAEFHLRQAPYTVAADVELPPAPNLGRLDLAIALDPINIGIRNWCSPPNADGIRTASTSATAPRWAPVRFGEVQQDPSLCASPALSPQRSRLRPTFAAVAGRVFTPTKQDPLKNGWGACVGAGIAIGD